MSSDSDRPAGWTNGSSEPFGLEGRSSNGSGNGTGGSALDLSRAVPLAVVLCAFIVFAVAGNVLVILSVVCNRHLRVPTNYFIVNLAIADLLLGTTVLPVSATLEVLDCWVFGRVFCDIWAALDVLCCTASIMSLCVISIDRYVGVRYPLQYPSIVTERRALMAMLGVWVLAVVISIGPLLGWKEPPSPDETVCPITEEPFYALFSSLGSFYIPLAVILAMYCRVYIVAKRTTRNLEAGVMRERMDSSELTLRIHHKSSQAQEDAAHPAKSSLAVKLFKFSREKKAAKTLGVVVGLFILCWLPFFLVLPMGSFNRNLRPPDVCFKVIFWLGYFNSCLNPIIYPCYNREFHQAFIRILRCQCRQRKRPGWAAYDHRSPRLAPANQQHKESLDEHSACLNGSQRTLSSAEASPSCVSNSLQPGFETRGLHSWPPSCSLPGGSMESHWDPFRGSSDESSDEHSATSSLFHTVSQTSFALSNGRVHSVDSGQGMDRTDSPENKMQSPPT